jgi:pyruvate formate lyase activating enzyme
MNKTKTPGLVGDINGVPARYWHTLEDGRIQCDLCPRLRPKKLRP